MQLAAVFALCSGARASSDPPSSCSAIVSAYSTLANAYQVGDNNVLKRLLAPDFILTYTTGANESASDTIADWSQSLQRSPDLSVTLRIINHSCSNRSGTFRITLTQRYTQGGHKVVDIQNEDDAWQLRHGTWLLAAAHTNSETTFLDGKQISSVVAPKQISESERQSLVTELRSQAWPIQSATPDGNQTDLQPLNRALGGASLIGMGEATHGTSEFFSLKDRIFRLLVRRKGFTVLAMEMPWISSLALDKYITSGQGDLRKVLAESFAVWDNQEVLQLFQWMRAYNAQPGQHARLRLVGIDMQGNTAMMVHLILDFLGSLDPSEVAPEKEKLECLNSYNRGAWSGAEGKKLVEQCASATNDVVNLFEKLKPSVPSERYLVAQHTAVVAHQLVCMYRYPYSLDQDDTRDHQMATNVQWFADTAFPNAKIAVWAHNGHVIAANASSGLVTMGEYLRRALGINYYAIGFAFDYGSVSVISNVNGTSKPTYFSAPPPSAVESILGQVPLSIYGLNLGVISPNSMLGRFLSSPQPMRNTEGETSDTETLNILNLKASFDTLIFVRESHPARSLEIK
ncbi:MAG: erythromycin esterase family protein [Candidatus Cybelea sp.]